MDSNGHCRLEEEYFEPRVLLTKEQNRQDLTLADHCVSSRRRQIKWTLQSLLAINWSWWNDWKRCLHPTACHNLVVLRGKSIDDDPKARHAIFVWPSTEPSIVLFIRSDVVGVLPLHVLHSTCDRKTAFFINGEGEAIGEKYCTYPKFKNSSPPRFFVAYPSPRLVSQSARPCNKENLYLLALLFGFMLLLVIDPLPGRKHKQFWFFVIRYLSKHLITISK